MTRDEIIEMAIQGHASTRDAIRWAMNHEREACAKVCEHLNSTEDYYGERIELFCAEAIRARGEKA